MLDLFIRKKELPLNRANPSSVPKYNHPSDVCATVIIEFTGNPCSICQLSTFSLGSAKAGGHGICAFESKTERLESIKNRNARIFIRPEYETIKLAKFLTLNRPTDQD
jgi:hypothetical protein